MTKIDSKGFISSPVLQWHLEDIEWDGNVIDIDDNAGSYWETENGDSGELEVLSLFNRWVIVDYDGIAVLPEKIRAKLIELFPTLL